MRERFVRGDSSGYLARGRARTAQQMLADKKMLDETGSWLYPVIYQLVPITLKELQAKAGKKNRGEE